MSPLVVGLAPLVLGAITVDSQVLPHGWQAGSQQKRLWNRRWKMPQPLLHEVGHDGLQLEPQLSLQVVVVQQEECFFQQPNQDLPQP